jgi:hypothetical protein
MKPENWTCKKKMNTSRSQLPLLWKSIEQIHWRQVTYSRISALTVVKNFNLLKDVLA